MMVRLALAVAGTILCGESFALDIKGFNVDAPLDCDHVTAVAHEMAGCATKERLVFDVNFLDSRSTLVIQRGPDGVVLMVAAKRFDYSDALDALTLKFGKPQITLSQLQNRMGAKFQQVEATWRTADQMLLLRKHSDELNKPELLLSGKALKELARKQRSEKAASGAGNI